MLKYNDLRSHKCLTRKAIEPNINNNNNFREWITPLGVLNEREIDLTFK